MSSIILDRKEILKYIKDRLLYLNSRCLSFKVCDAKYHHNATYTDAPSICKNGILTLSDLNRVGIKTYSSDILDKMSDIESHVNGSDGVSLAVMGLDDLYVNEAEYVPYLPTEVDFLVSSDVFARRTTINYGNEYVCPKSITNDNLKSVDIRLLNLISMLENNKSNCTVEDIVNRFNKVSEIASVIMDCNLDMKYREMSECGEFSIDVNKASELPKIYVK